MTPNPFKELRKYARHKDRCCGPPLELIHYLNYSTGEVKDYLNFIPKAAGVITNVKV